LYSGLSGTAFGCDFSGTIASLGHGVDLSFFSIGERVAGFVHGGIGKSGAFAEYVTSPSHTLIKLPPDWSFEQGAQLGIACFTACQCLYQSQALPTSLDPASAPFDLLVWSGSTSVGHYVIQFARQAGIRVITTSSPKHFDRLKSLGADAVFNYEDSKSGEKIRKYTQGKLTHAIDCISEKTSPFQVSNALSIDGGIISIVLPYKSRKDGVETIYRLAYAVLGEAFEFPEHYEPRSEDIKFGSWAAQFISRQLSTGKIVPLPVKLFPRGLVSVEEGLQYMQDGRVSAEKITYRIQDTPGLS